MKDMKKLLLTLLLITGFVESGWGAELSQQDSEALDRELQKKENKCVEKNGFTYFLDNNGDRFFFQNQEKPVHQCQTNSVSQQQKETVGTDVSSADDRITVPNNLDNQHNSGSSETFVASGQKEHAADLAAHDEKTLLQKAGNFIIQNKKITIPALGIAITTEAYFLIIKKYLDDRRTKLEKEGSDLSFWDWAWENKGRTFGTVALILAQAGIIGWLVKA